jgi:hypothetical protein
MNQRIHTIVIKSTPIRAQCNFGVALFNSVIDARCCKEHFVSRRGKPTGYVPLMDKNGEKGGKKRGTGSESAGCVDQRNRKNSGNADFAHRCELRERPKIRIERKA